MGTYVARRMGGTLAKDADPIALQSPRRSSCPRHVPSPRSSHLALGCLFHLWVQEPHIPEVACFFPEAGWLRFGQVLSQFAQPGFDFFLTWDKTSFLSRLALSLRGRHFMHLQRDVQYLISHLEIQVHGKTGGGDGGRIRGGGVRAIKTKTLMMSD